MSDEEKKVEETTEATAAPEAVEETKHVEVHAKFKKLVE